MTQKFKVAIIDDNKFSAYNLNVKLKFIGEEVISLTSKTWQKSLEDFEQSEEIFALVIGDLKYKKLAKLLEDISQWHGDIPVLVTGNEALPNDLNSEISEKIISTPERPIHYQTLLDMLKKAREFSDLEKPELKSVLISETGTAMFRSLVGESREMKNMRKLIKQLADRNVTVLITGESGTGKEIVARNLHYHSGRGEKPFVAVNCAAISIELSGVELFGQERGFNGAEKSRKGFFEKADGGTLFFDEIGDMPLPIQAKLLGFMELQSFERMGGSETLHTNVRVVASTHHNLEARIKEGQFREDLYYRLNVVPIEVPSLRQRAGDIPELVIDLISSLEQGHDSSIRFNSSAYLSLERHLWQGNVRELANLVERLSIIYPNAVIGVSDLPENYQHVDQEEIDRLDNPKQESTKESGQGQDDTEARNRQMLQPINDNNLREFLIKFEKNLIEVALDDCEGIVDLTAERLHMEPAVLEKKIKKHNILIRE